MKKLILLLAAFVASMVLAGCGGGSGSSTSYADSSGSSSVTQLKVTDNVVGTGAAAAAGNTLTVNYTGWLYSATATNYQGTQFDSSLATGGMPFSFKLGAGQVIAGWDQGLVGMQVGGTRTLIIPASLGYGAAGNGSIPGGAALVFQVTLLSIS